MNIIIQEKEPELGIILELVIETPINVYKETDKLELTISTLLNR